MEKIPIKTKSDLQFQLLFFYFSALKEGMMENKVIQKVAVIVPRQCNDQATQFWRKLREISPSLNIQMSDPFWLQIPDANVTTYTSVIERQVCFFFSSTKC